MMDYTLFPHDLIRKLMWYDINAADLGIMPSGNDVMDTYMFEFNDHITYDEIIEELDRMTASMLGNCLDDY